ncbi:GRIP and coiled-coil domain-containing protein 2 [Hondaea fermentalgiana]|uniref:GRIP and coiled-coil domain-containing protein 2 n=1 Tax=Hondaea fermentalgiana TaxID=2315210 RepID=A0A2R5GSF2_9STRA|nr:GRIP and coiled-coil domain-containing protein 2 [Hondaea fermentalgiana]|eukprot:GBG32688.1 GRIP and coiled-coil domain-containing protein 2 [Hondaea fermentalgiana]
MAGDAELSREELARFAKKKARQLKAREEEVAALQARVAALEQAAAKHAASDGDGEGQAAASNGADGEEAAAAQQQQQQQQQQEQELQAAVAKKDEAMKKLREVVPKFKALQTRFAKVKGEHAEASQRNETLEKELAGYKQHVEELEFKVQSLQDMVQSGLVDVEGAEHRAREALAETQQQLVVREKAIGDLQTQLETLQADHDAHLANLEDERHTSAGLRAELEAMQERLKQAEQAPPSGTDVLENLQGELEDALQSSAATIEELRAELDNARNSSAPHEEDEELFAETIETLRKDLEEAQARNAMRAQNENALSETVDSLQKQLAAKEHESKAAAEETQGLRDQLSEHEASALRLQNELSATIEKLEADVSARADENKALESKLEEMRTQRDHDDQDDIGDQVASTEDDRAALELVAKKLEEAHSELEIVRQELRESQASHQDKVENLETELTRARTELEDNQGELKTAKAEIEAAKTVSEDASQGHTDNEQIKKLEATLAQARNALEENQGELGTVKAELETAKAELEAAKAAPEDASQGHVDNEQVDALKAELAEVRGASEEKQGELETAKSELEAAKAASRDDSQYHVDNEHVETLETALAQAKGALEENQGELETVKAELETAKAELETAKAEPDALKAASEDAIKDHVDNEQIDALKAELAEVRGALEEKQGELETAKSELEAAKAASRDDSQYHVDNEHVETLETALAQAKGALEENQGELEAVKAELETAKAELETAKAEPDALKAASEDAIKDHEARGALEENQEELEAVKLAVEAVKTELETTKVERDALKAAPAEGHIDNEQLETLETALAQARSDLDESRELLERVRAEHAQELSVHGQQGENSMNEQVVALQAELEETRIALEAARVESGDNVAAQQTNPGERQSEAANVERLLQALALAESREEVAMDASLQANAALAAAEHDAKAREEEMKTEREALERKALEWKKRAAELSKRFKLAKERLVTFTKERDEAKSRHVSAVLHLFERSFVARRRKASALSRWRSATMAVARSTLEAQASDARAEAGKEVGEEREQRSKLEAECKRLEEQIQGHEAFSEKLKGMLSAARAEVESRQEAEAMARAAPPGFDPSKDILCAVKIGESTWVCVQCRQNDTGVDGGESVKQVDEAGEDSAEAGESFRWARAETIAKWAGSKRYALPETVDEVVRREFEHKVHESREQAAWALAEKEHLANDLAKAKRNAQLAVKAAKEGAKKVDAKAKATEAKLRSQLESELARVTRLADKRQEGIETIQAEKANVEIALAAARRDLAEAEKARNTLEASIAERFEEMRTRLARANEEALENAQADHEGAISSLRAKAETLETELSAAREALANAETSLQSAVSERKRSESSLLASQQETEELRARLKKVQETMATKKTPVTTYWKAPEHPERIAPEKTGVESVWGENAASGYPGDTDRENGAVFARASGEASHRQHVKDLGGKVGFGEEGGSSDQLPRNEAQRTMDPVLAAAASAWGSSAGDLSDAAADSGMTMSTQSQSLFVEQLDALRSQQARERVSWQREKDELCDRVEDAEKERKLLLEQVEVLKEEIRESRRSQARTQTLSAENSAVDDAKRVEDNLTYLKHVVFKYMVASDASERKTLLPVVGTILQFGPQDVEKIRAQLETEDAGGAGVAAARGVVGMLFGGGGS